MPTSRVVKPGLSGGPLPNLLTAIAALKACLERLPDPDHPQFYAGLCAALDACLPSLHRAYDAVIAEVLLTEGKRITCSKGCSACCRHFVSSVEPFELVALDRHLKSRPEYGDLVVSSFKRTMLYEKLVNEEEEGEEGGDRALYRYFRRGVPCPFLEPDGTCGVYEVRPMACRMFFAESPPRFCEGKELASPWNRNFQVELPQEAEEALARCSRLLEPLGLSEDLFPGLVAVNALFGRYDAIPSADSSGDSSSPAASADKR